MMGWAAWIAVGWATPADVTQSLSSGVTMDWTTLELQVTTTWRGGKAQGTRAVEQLARRELAALVEGHVGAVAVTPELTVSDLLEDPTLGPMVRSRLDRWVVEEARYFASGRVELDAVLSLQVLLKPWTLSNAAPGPPELGMTRYTGLVIDARGTGISPHWGPTVVDEHGAQLYGPSQVWEEQAVTEPLAIWVSDPAHPLSVRAGSEPLFVVAGGERDGQLVLTGDDAQRTADTLAGAPALGAGHVVIVIDE